MSSRAVPNLDDKPNKPAERNPVPHRDRYVYPNIDRHSRSNSVSR